jgi:phosphatidylserine decarboxylase
VAPEGYIFLVPLASVTLLSALVAWWPITVIGGLLTGCVAAFFRDPERRIPVTPGTVVSPADGRVMEIVEECKGQRISIFLSVLDVHINRAPYAGYVRAVTYTPGKFLAAYHGEASQVNEANVVALEHAGYTFVVKQIAGVLARRIVCRVQPGDVLEKGQRFGLIRFGSRTDLILPPEAEVLVSVGESVRGGESVLAILKESRDL